MNHHLDDRQAAWELHVELATRIAVAPLPPEQGLLSEALSSLECLSERTRQILREHGPHDEAGGCRFQQLSRVVIDEIVRPFLARWKSAVTAVCQDERLGAGVLDRERAWPERAVLRNELARMQSQLVVVATQLAELAGARSLMSRI